MLEGYGYRFLRINRFNVGRNPDRDSRSTSFSNCSSTVRGRIGHSESAHSAIQGIQKGELKECPKCKELRPLSQFEDTSLSFWIWTILPQTCKQRSPSRPRTSKAIKSTALHRCGIQEVHIAAVPGWKWEGGRYAKFYGCSRYPYCRATPQKRNELSEVQTRFNSLLLSTVPFERRTDHRSGRRVALY